MTHTSKEREDNSLYFFVFIRFMFFFLQKLQQIYKYIYKRKTLKKLGINKTHKNEEIKQIFSKKKMFSKVLSNKQTTFRRNLQSAKISIAKKHKILSMSCSLNISIFSAQVAVLCLFFRMGVWECDSY